MGYNGENVQKVKELLKSRYHNAISQSNRRRAEISEKLPGFARLDRELMDTGQQIVSKMMAKQMDAATLEAIHVRNREIKQRMRDLLVANGYPQDYIDVKFHCPLCEDNGYRGTMMCSCMRQALIEAGIESSGLAALIDSQTFDTFSLAYYEPDDRKYAEYNRTRLQQFAENFSTSSKDCWLLTGATGLGKTHLSTAVAGVVIRKGFDVIYDGVQEILGVYEEERFGRGDGEQHRRGRTVERLIECDLLIVDDLGTEIGNQFTVSSLYNLLSNRLNRGRSMIINTNLNQSEIRARYSDRIASRLFGEFTPLLFRGRDVRAQKLK